MKIPIHAPGIATDPVKHEKEHETDIDENLRFDRRLKFFKGVNRFEKGDKGKRTDEQVAGGQSVSLRITLFG